MLGQCEILISSSFQVDTNNCKIANIVFIFPKKLQSLILRSYKRLTEKRHSHDLSILKELVFLLSYNLSLEARRHHDNALDGA
jgi:hypothetical protein